MKRISALIFLFLFLITPLKAEEKKKYKPANQFVDDLKQLTNDYQAFGEFKGSIHTACMAFLSDYITNEQKIRLVNIARENLYNSRKRHSNPNKVEKKIISSFKTVNCFPEFK